MSTQSHPFHGKLHVGFGTFFFKATQFVPVVTCPFIIPWRPLSSSSCLCNHRELITIIPSEQESPIWHLNCLPLIPMAVAWFFTDEDRISHNCISSSWLTQTLVFGEKKKKERKNLLATLVGRQTVFFDCCQHDKKSNQMDCLRKSIKFNS